MLKTTILFGVVILSALFFLSCEKITMEPEIIGGKAIENIPAEYGSLVAVTTTELYPNWAQLWFQDTAGTVRMVRIQYLKHQMLQDVRVIPRTQPSGGGM